MWLKLTILILISCGMIFFGIYWYRKGISSGEEYDFKDDFKHAFLTPHLRYSDHQERGTKHKKIIPVVMMLAGLGTLAVGLVKILEAY